MMILWDRFQRWRQRRGRIKALKKIMKNNQGDERWAKVGEVLAEGIWEKMQEQHFLRNRPPIKFFPDQKQ